MGWEPVQVSGEPAECGGSVDHEQCQERDYYRSEKNSTGIDDQGLEKRMLIPPQFRGREAEDEEDVGKGEEDEPGGAEPVDCVG